jgi:hypothetical protein
MLCLLVRLDVARVYASLKFFGQNVFVQAHGHAQILPLKIIQGARLSIWLMIDVHLNRDMVGTGLALIQRRVKRVRRLCAVAQ